MLVDRVRLQAPFHFYDVRVITCWLEQRGRNPIRAFVHVRPVRVLLVHPPAMHTIDPRGARNSILEAFEPGCQNAARYE